MIAILDFGSQYTQLIAKKLRTMGFCSQIFRGPNTTPKDFNGLAVKGIVLSGSPWSVGQGVDPSPQIIDSGIPLLGLCFGYQFLAQYFGGKVITQSEREYGQAFVEPVSTGSQNNLLTDFDFKLPVWMSHGDSVVQIPAEAEMLMTSQKKPAAFWIPKKRIWALQFHPEVHHSPGGEVLLRNFAEVICGEKANWNSKTLYSKLSETIEQTIPKNETVYCAVSGGVDSTVLAALISQKRKVKALFVDHGFLREYDVQDLEKIFSNFPNIELKKIEASSVFWSELENVSDPELKRKIAGKLFVEVFQSSLKQEKGSSKPYLAQGTIYSDVIESALGEFGSVTQKIKSHHNVGGMPLEHGFNIVEPLRELFKDEVRWLGKEIGINEEFLNRHPFPGPGLMIRCLGPLNKTRIETLRKADQVFIEELKKRKLYNQTWQAFCVLLPIETVGVMGDERSYESVLALRAVNSVDAMTAEVTRFPWADLQEIATKIINQVKGINRVVYDLTSKPPATIEWE